MSKKKALKEYIIEYIRRYDLLSNEDITNLFISENIDKIINDLTCHLSCIIDIRVDDFMEIKNG